MADYYNRTRTPVSIGFRNGQSVVIGPKRWTFISPEDEGSESLIAALNRGDVVRAKVDRTLQQAEAAPVISEPAPVPAPAPLPLTEVVPAEAAKNLLEKKKTKSER